MTVKKAIKILYHEATNEERTHSLEEIKEAKKQLEMSLIFYDYVEDAREYPLYQFSKDKPKFILIGGYSINLKEIRQYSLEVTKAYGQLPDGTPKMAESWGLAIWLYGDNRPRSVGYGTKEEAEKLKEKLDNIFGVVDLGKEN